MKCMGADDADVESITVDTEKSRMEESLKTATAERDKALAERDAARAERDLALSKAKTASVQPTAPAQPARLDPTLLALVAILVGGAFGSGWAAGASSKKIKYKDNCDNNDWSPLEPGIPGIKSGTDKPRIILGIDVDYPP